MTDEQAAWGMLMRAIHHTYCKDTGCFDGDDISNPEIEAAINAYRKIVVAEVLGKAVCAREEAGMLRCVDGREWGAPLPLRRYCATCRQLEYES